MPASLARARVTDGARGARERRQKEETQTPHIMYGDAHAPGVRPGANVWKVVEEHGWLLTAVVIVVSIVAPYVFAYLRAREMERDASDTEKLRAYASARRKALDKVEEDMRSEYAKNGVAKNAALGSEEAQARKLAEIDAKAARLGVLPKGKGRVLGSDPTLRRDDYNPLVGASSSTGRGYRPTQRQRPGGGG